MYLGIDIGTQSVKALLYDLQGQRVVDVQSAPLELISAADGTREQHAQWWLDALGRSVSALDARSRQAVRAIGVSGQQHGFVPLAADGTVLRAAKLWCDTVTAPECEQIMGAFGGKQRCVEEVGNPILPGYTAPKIRWLKKHEPQAYSKLATVLLPHDYVNYYLTGELGMECGDASGTGLLDIRSRRWHCGMIDALDHERDLSTALPPLVAHDVPFGRLLPAVATSLGLPAGAMVSCGGGDNMMAAIGTGAVSPGHMTVSLGTSGTLFASAEQPVIGNGEALAAFCSSTGGWLPLLCTMNCTVSTELTRKLFALDVSALDAAVGAVAPGAGGVMTLPFFNGERTPDLPAGKGCILGLDESNYSSANLLRSAMESSVFGLRVGLDAFREQGCDIGQLRLTGGGAGSANWRQMVADIFDLPVTVQAVDEGAALGAALQAAWVDARQDDPGLQLQDLLDEQLSIDESRSAAPESTAVDFYERHYTQYQRHVAAITPLYS